MLTITLSGRIGKPRSAAELRLERCLKEIRDYADEIERKGDADAAEACSAAVWDVLIDWEMIHRRRQSRAVRTVKNPTLPQGGDDDLRDLAEDWSMS